jgi:hypothetical protein
MHLGASPEPQIPQQVAGDEPVAIQWKNQDEQNRQ